MSRRASKKVVSSQKRRRVSESLATTRPTIILIDADTHFGSVLSPVVRFLKTNGQYETPTKQQAHLAGERERMIDHFASEKAKTGAALVYVHMGDVVEGIKHRSKQRISDDPTDQITLAQTALRPALDLADIIIALRGTEAHDGIGNEYGDAVFAPWKAKTWRPEGWESPTVYRALVEISGVRFDLEHHVDGASRPWTRGGNIQRRAVSSVYEMLKDNIGQADYIFRAHTHDAFDSGMNPPFPRGIVCRPWKGRGDAFAHRIASSNPVTVGAQYVTVNGPGDHVFRWWDCLSEERATWHTVKMPTKKAGRK